MKKIQGIPASGGIAIGAWWVYRPVEVTVTRRTVADVTAEKGRLVAAIKTAVSQLQALAEKTAATIGAEEAEIFEAHQMFLDDPELIELIEGQLEADKLNAEAAVETAVDQYASAFEALEDDYFRARAADVRDVGGRLIRCLLGVSDQMAQPNRPVLILADDLTPSDTVQFKKENVLGLATVRGGPTSHTAILARTIGIPAVVSLPLPLDELGEGGTAVLNGESGELVLEPTEALLAEARAQAEAWRSQREADHGQAHEPAVTLDGHQVEVVANIGNVVDAKEAIAAGAEGVGLFRTEFLYLDRQTMPTEAEQIESYRQVAEVMNGRPLVVRTLDIGGDKAVPYLGFTEEPNPFLGWRAFRMRDKHHELFVSQLRALLVGMREADLRIMFPMVSSVREVQAARAMLDEAKASLEAEGTPYAQQVQIGIMIEVPAAALLARQLAPLVDFFSIGTNDLTQYTLAVDRMNERVAHLASPFHPAVLRLIWETIAAAHENGRWVGLCGEFAGDPLAAPFLLGVGLDEFSMAAASIPTVKAALRRLDKGKCAALAEEVLELGTVAEVKGVLETAVLNDK